MVPAGGVMAFLLLKFLSDIAGRQYFVIMIVIVPFPGGIALFSSLMDVTVLKHAQIKAFSRVVTVCVK